MRDDEAPEAEAHYPLMTNQPGAVLMDPVRRLRAGVLTLLLAIVVVSGTSAYVATLLAGRKTDQHTDELLAELNRRTAERRHNEAVSAAVLEQNRRTLCELLPVAQTGDPVRQQKLRRLVVAYRCGTANDPIVPPGWSPPAGWPPLPPGPDGFSPSPTPSPTGGG